MILNYPESWHVAHRHHRSGSFSTRTRFRLASVGAVSDGVSASVAVPMGDRGSGPIRRHGFTSQNVPPANWSDVSLWTSALRAKHNQFRFYKSFTTHSRGADFPHVLSLKSECGCLVFIP